MSALGSLWIVVSYPDGIHVAPIGDLREHDRRADCWCGPTPDAEEPMVLVHHSLDDRESFETGRRLPS